MKTSTLSATSFWSLSRQNVDVFLILDKHESLWRFQNLIGCRSHATKCGTTWFCHIPFCPEVKGMPSFEWLKIKERGNKGNSQKFQKFPNQSGLFHEKECMISACW